MSAKILRGSSDPKIFVIIGTKKFYLLIWTEFLDKTTTEESY